jgi:flagellar FliL protein
MFKRKKKDKAAVEGEEAKEGEEKKEEKAPAKEEPKEEAKEGEANEGEEGAEGEGAPKKGKRKLIIIIGGAVVLIGVIVGVLFAVGVIGGGAKDEAAEGGHGGGHGEEAVVLNAPVYYELPEFLVNLSSTTNRASFLKMRVTLELRDQAAVALVEANKPRIVDTFNTYLRELRAPDVQGSAGIYRLRDELLSRINGTVQEGLVKDILFSEIIVQ